MLMIDAATIAALGPVLVGLAALVWAVRRRP
jgi:hypothetical protein